VKHPTLAVALLSTALLGVPGFRGQAAAQAATTRIAYDQCWADGGAYDSYCSIGTVVDGHDALVANGIGPRWSPDGSRIAFTGGDDPGARYYLSGSYAEVLSWSAADGSVTNLTNHPANDWSPVWSRDGTKIAFVSDRDGSPEIYVMEASGANPTRVTHDVEFAGTFGWSPDGGRLAFASARDGVLELYVIDADGSNLTRLTNDVGFAGPLAWSPDGSRIAFDCVGAGGADICAVGGDGTHFVRLTTDPARDWGAAFSPVDGRIAFVTERFGAGPEIAVMDAEGAVARLAAGTGGTQPVWSPDGQRLTFVTTTPSFSTGTCYFDPGPHNADDFCGFVYDMDVVNADGTGLTTIASGADPNWFAPRPGQPVAAFTPACSAGTCSFDAAGSFDPDGTIASYAWQFGDGTSDSGPVAQHAYAAAGPYGVTLTVTDDGGATGIVRVMVPDPIAPVASFTVTCSGPTCTFDGSGSSDADGTVARYFWNFGDGGVNVGAVVHHTYPTGTFSARLTAIDDTGTRGTASQTVSVVNAPPVATFTYTCNGFTCAFDGSGSSDPDGTIGIYQWYFGDGGYALGPTASHTFAAGTYTVKLVVTSSDSSEGTQSQTLSIGANAPPIASFTFACSGLTCSFDASASSDPDGRILRYAWDFGDGTTLISGSIPPIASRTYAAHGAYTVTLTVTDNGNAASQTTHVVTVSAPNAPPVASFTSACSALTCSFNASGSSDPDGTIASYAWSFGDGTSASGVTASHTYAAGGTYSVTLTVTDNAAATGQAAGSVTVVAPNVPPVASFTSACSALTCSFNASGSSDPDGTIASYAWTFGDGTSASGVTVSHAYAAGGTYSVTLTVTDNAAATSTQAQSVTVAPPEMHVGDLDRASTSQQNNWTATVTITVHNGGHGPLANAVVGGAWNGGSTGSCTTNASGQCAVSRTGIPKSSGTVSFTVTGVSLGIYVYRPASNHDPDGDSNGTTITVMKP